ncbi:MAG: ATP-binding protein [Spirochaetes bacterium]|nr:ATP-binding protein [Spirochaetota bacterium]
MSSMIENQIEEQIVNVFPEYRHYDLPKSDSLSRIIDKIEKDYEVNEFMANINAIDEIVNSDDPLQKINIYQLYSDILEIVDKNDDNLLGNNINFVVTEIPESLKNLNIICQTNHFKDIMNELLINSIKFSPKNDRVILNLRITQNNLVICIENVLRNHHVHDDRIIDLPQDFQQVLFEPFKRFGNLSDFYKNEKWKYGLGLFAVKKMAEKMNGDVQCSCGICYQSNETPKPIITFKLKLKLAD